MAQRLVFLFVIIGLVQCKLLKLTCDEKSQFVDGHNSRRLQVASGKVRGQPSAEKMNSVIWDEELAAKAAHWASQNQKGHNPDRSVPSGKYKSTGENLHSFWTSNKAYKFDVDSALASWFGEHKDFTFSAKPSNHTNRPKTGHYTQMIWSDSTHIGCAVSQTPDGRWNKFFVVCNYGPAGNVRGEKPYRTGQSGELACGAGNCNRPYGRC